MVATYIKNIMPNVLCVTYVYLREIINTFFLGGGIHLNVSCSSVAADPMVLIFVYVWFSLQLFYTPPPSPR